MTLINPYQNAAQFYDQYRPQYPAELIEFLLSLVTKRDRYLDLGCGTGALLFKLSPFFQAAVGVDIDADMFQEAIKRKQDPAYDNITLILQKAEDYLVQQVEKVDLITAGRAIHWMDQALILQSAYHLLETQGVFALVGECHSLWDHPSPPFQKIYDIIASFERMKGVRHLPAQGKDTSFQVTLDLIRASPFKTYEQKEFSLEYSWTIDHILRYVYSASGFVNWLGQEREEFEEQVKTELRQLSHSGTFPDQLNFGITYCRK